MGNASGKKTTFGLTPKEKKIIRETWNLINKDLGRTGLVVFVIYFREYPHNLSYFPFKVANLDDLEREPLVKLHALRVMRELGYYVEHIDRQETLMYSLRQNALSHRKRAIHQRAYDELRLSMLKGFTTQLGAHKFGPETTSVWDKALRVIFQIITDINDERKCLCVGPNQTRTPASDQSAASTSKPKK